MKKFALALVALLALSFTFMSCDAPADQVLEADDVTADWFNGTWSGTQTTTTYDGDGAELTKVTITVTAEPAAVEGLKATIKLDGTEIMAFGTGMKISSVVKANKKRTKLYMETITENYFNDKLVDKTVIVSEVEKD